MQLDSRQIKILQEMGLPTSLYAIRSNGQTQVALDVAKSSHEPSKLNSPTTNHFAPSKVQTVEIGLHRTSLGIVKEPNQGPITNQVSNQHISLEPRQVSAFGPIIAQNYDLLQVADLSWGELKAKAAGCLSCDISKTRKYVSFGSQIDIHSNKKLPPLPADCVEDLDWLVIDFMPSDVEDQTRNPLASETGELLSSMLKALLQIDKLKIGGDTDGFKNLKSMALINAVKCHAPGGRSAHPFEVQQCSSYLQRQIELLKPKALLILGMHAYKAVFINKNKNDSSNLTQQIPFAQLRSEKHNYDHIPAFVTYHPSYLLTHPEDKSKVWLDLCRAHQEIFALKLDA